MSEGLVGMTRPVDVVRREIAAEKPRWVSLLSPHARERAIERGITSLYRWYSTHSQRRRSWCADTCVDWRTLNRDHNPAVSIIVEGFFAVEQYTPDYVTALLRIIRDSYGRSQWHIRWGAEEERHADLWRNCVLALGKHTEDSLESYARELRAREWKLPWDSARHMVFYQVIQEKATQISYLNLGLAARGDSHRLVTHKDAALERICRLIAIDEAAHYSFFVEAARLLLYYQPEESLEAIVEVLRHFTMPARDVIPNYDTFAAVLHTTGVFGRSIHYRDVVQVVLNALSAPALRELEEGIKRAREVPRTDGMHRTASFIDTLDFGTIAGKIQLLFSRSRSHLERSGLSPLFESGWLPAWTVSETTSV